MLKKEFFAKLFFIIFFAVILVCKNVFIYAQSLEEEIDLYCLKLSYPQITGIEKNAANEIWLKLNNGAKAAYLEKNTKNSNLTGNIKESMEQIYPLENDRPAIPQGFAPGRKRPYKFFEEIYGSTPAQVKETLHSIPFLNKKIQLSGHAASSFKNVGLALTELISQKNDIKKFLEPEGGYYWRNIAGEKHLSAHSYGIALDIGVKHSPYWRWSKIHPHPLQKTYPHEIVKEFEKNGFIWGGKWHEYDIMHYEYRPELICKAHMMKMQGKKFSLPEKGLFGTSTGLK